VRELLASAGTPPYSPDLAPKLLVSVPKDKENIERKAFI
jgi:hypothetical protein